MKKFKNTALHVRKFRINHSILFRVIFAFCEAWNAPVQPLSIINDTLMNLEVDNGEFPRRTQKLLFIIIIVITEVRANVRLSSNFSIRCVIALEPPNIMLVLQ